MREPRDFSRSKRMASTAARFSESGVMSRLALFLLLSHGLVRVVVVAVDLAADVALQPVHREVHAAQAPGLVGLLDAEERVSGRIDTDLANRKRRTHLDERVYPRRLQCRLQRRAGAG